MMTAPFLTRLPLGWSGRDMYPGLTAAAIVGAFAFLALRVFGLPSVDLHTPLHYAGIMDPLCGMTRAVWLLGKGRLGQAWSYNPGAYVLALAGTFLIVRAVIGATTHRWLNWDGRPRRVVWIVVAVAVAGLWVNQQANADLLSTRGI